MPTEKQIEEAAKSLKGYVYTQRNLSNVRRMSDTSKKVLAILAEHPEKQFRAGVVARLICGIDSDRASRNRVFGTFTNLYKLGHVKRVGPGLYQHKRPKAPANNCFGEAANWLR